MKKILIIKPSALGDIVMALPAACCLKDNFPDAQIHWFIRPEFAPLIECHKCIDKLVIFQRRKLGKWWCKLSAFAELIRLVKQLRRENYDIVFDFQGRFRSAIFAWLSGCKKRFGPAKTQEFTKPFYTDRIAASQQSVNVVDYFIDMVCSAGAKRGDVRFGLEPQKQAVDESGKILSDNKIDKDNYAVLVPGATVEAKRWPVENFAGLANKVSEKYQYGIVLSGVESEKEIAEKLKSLASVPVVNLAGGTNIGQLVALLSQAKFVVSNDTGPAHIAAALGVPIALVFGLTNPNRVGPYDRPQTVAAVEIDKRGSEVESTNPAHDIKNVTVETVLEIISKQL
ncbi:MAG: lipopolysaccharide heptosyltransferase II [Phycisphaerae bacterium]|nr:lipopolysaccharide heptosyltransferase II [Phycisphaerae bacterium]